MTFSLLAAPVVAALALSPATGPGSVGVGIGAAPVCLAVLAQPGSTYQLGDVGIEDTGSAAESITVRVEPPSINGLAGIPVPPSWVSIGYPRTLWIIPGSSVSLAAGGSAYLPVTLHVPGGARPGLYGADLTAGTASPSSSHGAGGTAVFGAAAATNLVFTVAGPGLAAPSCGPGTADAGASAPAGQMQAASTAAPSPAPPRYAVLGVLAAVIVIARAAASQLRRRGHRRSR